MHRLRTAIAAVACLAGPWLAGCGSSTPAAPSGGAPAASSRTVTITAAGASPLVIQVSVGDRVLFVNKDTIEHNMTSDPHPEHDACPEINQAGYLLPGQSRETGNLVVPETCGFHDHDHPDNQTLHGQILIK